MCVNSGEMLGDTVVALGGFSFGHMYRDIGPDPTRRSGYVLLGEPRQSLVASRPRLKLPFHGRNRPYASTIGKIWIMVVHQIP